MSYFLALHTWKEEDLKVVARKVIEAIPSLPIGTTLLSSFIDARQIGAYCVYETEKPEDLKEFLEERAPEMTTEMIPILQFFPPAADVYKLMHILAS
jgi:hypothetical protein